MKNILFLMMIFLPFIALGQGEISSVHHMSTETEPEKHPLWKSFIDSEGHLATTLIDDRNYYKSLINYDLNKPYNLSSTAKNKRFFKLSEGKDSDEKLLESVPFLDFRW